MKPLNRTTANISTSFPLRIIQFGGGNFLRAFSCWMIEILNEQTDFQAGVICVKPTDAGDYKNLREQEGLYHVLTKGIEAGELIEEKKLITCVQKIIHPYLEWEAYLQTATISSIKYIISNTTESGIQFNEKDCFEAKPPKEFPAKLTLWLYHRWQHFKGSPESGCVCLPCELIDQNGEALKNCILKYIYLWKLNSNFKNWINQHTIFCDTLVDRIVPGFPKTNPTEIYADLGYQDKLVVIAEPYYSWVIEAPTEEVLGQIPFHLSNLNVQFTTDLNSHRQLKVRILNGAHTAMVPIGYMAGIESVRTVVEHECLGGFLQQLIQKEILPTLDYPKEQLEKYSLTIFDRFKNPYIKHQLINISLNSISKFKVRLLPSLLTYVAIHHQLPKRICFAFAALLYFYSGKRNGQIIPIKAAPEVLSFFQDFWQLELVSLEHAQEKTTKLLAKRDFWEQDLNEIPNLNTVMSSYLWEIRKHGILKSLDIHFEL